MESRKSKNITIAGKEIALVVLNQAEQLEVNLKIAKEVSDLVTKHKLTDSNSLERITDIVSAVQLINHICREPSDLNVHITELEKILSTDEVSDVLYEYNKFRQELKDEKKSTGNLSVFSGKT